MLALYQQIWLLIIKNTKLNLPNNQICRFENNNIKCNEVQIMRRALRRINVDLINNASFNFNNFTIHDLKKFQTCEFQHTIVAL